MCMNSSDGSALSDSQRYHNVFGLGVAYILLFDGHRFAYGPETGMQNMAHQHASGRMSASPPDSRRGQGPYRV